MNESEFRLLELEILEYVLKPRYLYLGYKWQSRRLTVFPATQINNKNQRKRERKKPRANLIEKKNMSNQR